MRLIDADELKKYISNMPLTNSAKEMFQHAIKSQPIAYDIDKEHNKMCDTCIQKVSKEDIEQIRAEAYNQALEDAEKRYREWSKTEYGKVADDDMLPIRVLRSLTTENNH